jgi:hypothetical protein
MSVSFLRHTNEPAVISYHTRLSYYYNSDFINAYKFITENIDGVPHIIPIHKTKCEDSNFKEHIYYHDAKKLLRNREMIDGVERYYCISCPRNKDGSLKLARIIKNEYLKGKNANECKSCYLGR